MSLREFDYHMWLSWLYDTRENFSEVRYIESQVVLWQ